MSTAAITEALTKQHSKIYYHNLVPEKKKRLRKAKARATKVDGTNPLLI